MPARALYKAVISFAGVSVPVKLYTAVRKQSIQFHLLHDDDRARLTQQIICSLEERPVERDETIRGYETGEDEYVIIQDAELDALEPEPTRDIDVVEFVESADIDPRYFERPYHLGPDGDEKKFAALIAALEKTGKAGICKWVMRKKRYFGALYPRENTLSLVAMRYAEEVNPISKLGLPKAEASERELKTAEYLINELSADFVPEHYADEYQGRLADFIRKKAKGEKIELPEPEREEATKEEELLSLLEESLESARAAKTAR